MYSTGPRSSTWFPALRLFLNNPRVFMRPVRVEQHSEESRTTLWRGISFAVENTFLIPLLPNDGEKYCLHYPGWWRDWCGWTYFLLHNENSFCALFNTKNYLNESSGELAGTFEGKLFTSWNDAKLVSVFRASLRLPLLLLLLKYNEKQKTNDADKAIYQLRRLWNALEIASLKSSSLGADNVFPHSTDGHCYPWVN